MALTFYAEYIVTLYSYYGISRHDFCRFLKSLLSVSRDVPELPEREEGEGEESELQNAGYSNWSHPRRLVGLYFFDV